MIVYEWLSFDTENQIINGKNQLNLTLKERDIKD